MYPWIEKYNCNPGSANRPQNNIPRRKNNLKESLFYLEFSEGTFN
jgi:hypothetical protein